ncbi:MAG: response regulator [Candidatus Pacebacteria bacterium]|nr:response regulator [Candidatus Paceibacterota bacterium]
MEPNKMPHVLLLDDNVEVSHMYARAFRNQNCETRALYDAEAALKELKDGDFVPDVIVIDVMMPNMNGLQFLAELRTDPRFAKVPAVALTNMKADEYASQFSDPSIALYLNKLDHELKDVVDQVIAVIKK